MRASRLAAYRARLLRLVRPGAVLLLEIACLVLVAAGLWQIYHPLGLIGGGIIGVFIAQGLEPEARL